MEKKTSLVQETLDLLKKVLVAEQENNINEAFWKECDIFENLRKMTKAESFVYRTLANEMVIEFQRLNG